MKQTVFAWAAALALGFALTGCSRSLPETVGSLGGVEISAGLYRLAQYNAYQQAADLAAEGQDAKDVKHFLEETVLVDAASGQTALVSDYVAQKTLEELELCAAVETRFDECSGALTAEEEAQADSYAAQLWEQYGSTYKANGIDFEALVRYEQILCKQNALLLLLYGPGGAEAVSDAELTAYLQNEMLYACYTLVPLYNIETYTAATDEEAAQMLTLAAGAAARYNGIVPATTSEQGAAFRSAVQAALPDILGVLGNSGTGADAAFSTGFLPASVLDADFSQEDAALLRALQPGEAAAVRYADSALLLLVRLDPLDETAAGLDAVREEVLRERNGAELAQSLREYGAKLEHRLDESAIEQLPASAIVNN